VLPKDTTSTCTETGTGAVFLEQRRPHSNWPVVGAAAAADDVFKDRADGGATLTEMA